MASRQAIRQGLTGLAVTLILGAAGILGWASAASGAVVGDPEWLGCPPNPATPYDFDTCTGMAALADDLSAVRGELRNYNGQAQPYGTQYLYWYQTATGTQISGADRVCLRRDYQSQPNYVVVAYGATTYTSGYLYGAITTLWTSTGDPPSGYSDASTWYLYAITGTNCGGDDPGEPQPDIDDTVPSGGWPSGHPERFDPWARQLGVCGSVPPSVLMGLAQIESEFGVTVEEAPDSTGPYLIPAATWSSWGADANADQVTDPYHVGDSMTTIRDLLVYLMGESGALQAALREWAGASGDTYDRDVLAAAAEWSSLDDDVCGDGNGAPGSGTPGSGGTPGSNGLGECAPTGWGLLNPIEYVRGLWCVLEALFVPEDDLGALWDEVTAAAGTSWPWGPVQWVASEGAEIIDAYRDGLGMGGVGCDYGPTLNIGQTSTTLVVVNNCSGANQPYEGLRTVVYLLSKVVAVMGLVFGLWRIGAWVMGGGSNPIPGEDT